MTHGSCRLYDDLLPFRPIKAAMLYSFLQSRAEHNRTEQSPSWQIEPEQLYSFQSPSRQIEPEQLYT